MYESHINYAKLSKLLARFASFIQDKDGREGISFRDTTGFLGREEDYKSRVAEAAREALNTRAWKKSWIGTGKIAECARKMIDKSDNLVHYNQKTNFKNRLDSNHDMFREDAEKVLYDIYRNPLCDEATAFSEAVEVFGAKYDTVAFLFFIKDDTRFLPIRTRYFDESFSILDIDYKTSFSCNWNNYIGYIDIIREIRDEMDAKLPIVGTPRLIDAHSFVWVIHEKKFLDWNPSEEQCTDIEKNAEGYLYNEVTSPGGKRHTYTSNYNRSAAVAKETRDRAKGVCQLCNQPAPFNDKKGEPYLEVHHIVWLSRQGKDSTANTVALCSNCHARMHVLDKASDVRKLKEVVKNCSFSKEGNGVA